MRAIAALLLSGLFLASCQGQMWNYQNSLYGNLQNLGQRISENVQAQVAEIQKNVAERVKNINSDVNAQVAQVQQNVAATIKNVHTGSYPYGSSTNTVVINGYGTDGLPSYPSSISVSVNGNRAHTRVTGTDENGQFYTLERVDITKDNTLYRTERRYNIENKLISETNSTLDLSNPNASHVYVNSTGNA